jgi:hypothetical protein
VGWERMSSVVLRTYRAGITSPHVCRGSLVWVALYPAAFVLAVEEEGDDGCSLLAARTYGTLLNNAGALFCDLFGFSR